MVFLCFYLDVVLLCGALLPVCFFHLESVSQPPHRGQNTHPKNMEYEQGE
jgi:hypothetical protein